MNASAEMPSNRFRLAMEAVYGGFCLRLRCSSTGGDFDLLPFDFDSWLFRNVFAGISLEVVHQGISIQSSRVQSIALGIPNRGEAVASRGHEAVSDDSVGGFWIDGLAVHGR